MKPVRQFTVDGVFVNEFPSAKYAAMNMGVSKTAIKVCCLGRLRTVKGYVFKYSEDCING